MSRSHCIYGQIVAGAPGAGKSTYCNGMQQYLRLIGRNACVINLDPANEIIKGERSYDAIWDVTEHVIHLKRVMQDLELGPNGGLLYCMEYLNEHSDVWLPDLMKLLSEQDEQPYVLIDLPGQSEIYTHGTSVSSLIKKLIKNWSLRLTVVQLVDATLCLDANQFLSSSVISLASMIRLELPTISILSKSDLLLKSSHKMDLLFSMDFFLECQSLHCLVDYLDQHEGFDQDDFDIAEDEEYQIARNRVKHSSFSRRRRTLFEGLAEVVEDYGLLHFQPLDISNATSVGRALQKIDRANGYIYVTTNTISDDLFQVAVQEGENLFETVSNIQERYQTE
jgi:GPN-loop GTPase